MCLRTVCGCRARRARHPHVCALSALAANANGITLDNLMRFDSTTGVQGIEHWLNLWYELAIKYGGASNVWCV